MAKRCSLICCLLLTLKVARFVPAKHPYLEKGLFIAFLATLACLIAAVIFSAVAVPRHPRSRATWATFAFALAALTAEAHFFLTTQVI